jgi:hypothetical protein
MKRGKRNGFISEPRKWSSVVSEVMMWRPKLAAVGVDVLVEL